MIGALFIVSNQNLALADPENRAVFTKEYKIWLSGVFDNTIELTGDFVKLEWLPDVAPKEEIQKTQVKLSPDK